MENQKKRPGEIEINLIEILQKLWINRRFILKITSFFAFFGIFIALFSAKVYTSNVILVPQLNDNKSKLNGLAGLAAMAGVNIGSLGENDVLPPTTYSLIMENGFFLKDLMNTKIKFENVNEPVSLYDYYCNSKYQSFDLFSFLKKYTIGLPGLLIKTMKGDRNENLQSIKSSTLLHFTEKEYKVSEILKDNIALEFNQKEGTIKLSADMPDAIAAAQVVEVTRLLLEKYIINFKIEKVKQNLDFISEQFEEAKKDFEKKQLALAEFQDANQNVIQASKKTNEDRLTNEMTLSFNVYSELAKQLEQAKINVKEMQPVLTVIEPASVPLKKSKPNRPLILIGFIFLGFFFSSSYLLFRFYVEENNEKQ